MFSLFGKILLLLATLSALLQCVLPLLGQYRQQAFLLAVARPALYAQVIFITLAYSLLCAAFIIDDFNIIYVAMNSHATLPFIYKLTAVWGGHEGSILLWILLVNLWGFLFAIFPAPIDFSMRTLALVILGGISFGFLCFLSFTSNPFLTSSTPLVPRDLNPLLQDPGFVIHPPMLYAGYAGFAIIFALGLAGLIYNKLDLTWARLSRIFVLSTWSLLTLGITLGSWWAYRVLGWGGFWFWDPVENASLLPWLSATALLHLFILVIKKQIYFYFTALLTIISFALSLLGMFLVRSGILISVHSFAADPARGIFLLILLGLLISLALGIWLFRFYNTQNTKTIILSWPHRELSLIMQSALILICLLTLLLGTLYPLITDLLHLGPLSVGAPYFNSVMSPLLYALLALMGLVAFCNYYPHDMLVSWQFISKIALFCFISSSIFIIYLTKQFEVYTIAALSLSLWVIISIWYTKKRHFLGMALAHVGFAILVIGIALTSSMQQEREVRLSPGRTTKIGPYQFFFVGTSGLRASNYRGIRAHFDVFKNTQPVASLYPEKRIYIVRDMVMTKVAIHPSIFRDLYLALGEPLTEEEWSVRIYYKPFIRWIWMGAFLMVLGGFFSIRYRGHSC